MAKKRLTTRFIDSLKPPKAGRAEYWDAGTPGFGLRVSYSGRKTWVLMYRHHRRLRRLTLGTYPALTLAKARERAKAALQEVADGKDPASAKKAEREANTFGELAEQYVEKHARRNKATWKEDRRALDRDLLPRFGHRVAASIRRGEVIECLEEIRDRGAPILALRTHEIMRRIYSWGIARELIEANPCLGIEPVSKQVSRERTYTPDEITTLWQTFSGTAGDIYRLILVLGQRKTEVSDMAWPELDLDRSLWLVPAERMKHGKTHMVPLPELALGIIRERPQTSEYVFPSPVNLDRPFRSLGRAAKEVKTLSGIVDFRSHDLRRTCGSGITELGFSRFIMDRVLGHLEAGIGARYDRYGYLKEKAAALTAWAQRLEEILSGQPVPGTAKVVNLRG